METFSYSDLLRQLESFDGWLSSLGLTPRPNDRIHEAFNVLRWAEEASRQSRETGTYTNIRPGDWSLIIEALEACAIFSAFHDDSSPAIAASLKRALSGPIQASDENQKNRDGRNIWYELALAADWRMRGADVSIEEPDLRLSRDGITFLVACKRPANRQSIEANLRTAVKQLRHNLDNTPPGAYGVAAISLTCVFNRGDKVFSGDVNALGNLVRHELDPHRDYLRSIDDPRICFVIFDVATPAVAEEDVDLVRASFTIGIELNGPSIGSKAFEQHARDMSTRLNSITHRT